MNRTNTAENKQIVLNGLKRRADRLDVFESEMINACHLNCTEAREQREKDAVALNAAAYRKLQARAKMKAMHTAQKQEMEATRAVNTYLATVIGLLLLAAGTRFPYWASITLILGLAVILAVHLYRIYVPLESEMAG